MSMLTLKKKSQILSNLVLLVSLLQLGGCLPWAAPAAAGAQAIEKARVYIWSSGSSTDSPPPASEGGDKPESTPTPAPAEGGDGESGPQRSGCPLGAAHCAATVNGLCNGCRQACPMQTQED
jgi:hypothetical protein